MLGRRARRCAWRRFVTLSSFPMRGLVAPLYD
jgi:hypothetical protein